MIARPQAPIVPLALAAACAVLSFVPAQADDNDWTKVPPRSFNVQSLNIEDVVGGLTIDVKDGGPVVVDVSGVQWKVQKLAIRQSGSALRIEGTGDGKVWDWKRWFDFRHLGKDETRNLYVHVSVPKGMAVKVENMIGKARVGDTYGPITFETAGSADSSIGNVARANVSLAGSGKVSIGNIGGDFHAETAGSGDIVARDVGGRIHAEIAGSGSVAAGRIARGTHVEIAGSGDFTAAAVNGPTHVEIAGSGSVTIAGGEADPLHIEIMGSGDVSFGGTAVDPNIESMGSGNVTLKAYRGRLSTDGNVHLKTGK